MALGLSEPVAEVAGDDEIESPARKAARLRRTRIVVGTISLGSLILLYTLVSNFSGVNPALMPPPQAIGATFWRMMADGSLWEDTAASLLRILVGYSIGTSLAILIGTLMGWFRIVEFIFDPIVEAFRPVPPLAYIPLIILWIGIGEESRILVLVMASFLTCIVNAYSGMKQVPRVYVEAARTLGASEATIFRRVALPFALPYIFAGMRVAMAASWATLVAAELVAAQSGLGYMLQAGRRFFDTSVVMVGIITIGILAFTLDRLFRFAQSRLNRWEEVER